ncbi:MAG: hypothetical protein NTY15_03675 [Planctomycetota bacterium]|nr:hypothetical protein [Planctomycetota bacterium]
MLRSSDRCSAVQADAMQSRISIQVRFNRECDGIFQPGVKFASRTQPQVPRPDRLRALKERHCPRIDCINKRIVDFGLVREQRGNAVALRLNRNEITLYHGLHPWLSNATASQFRTLLRNSFRCSAVQTDAPQFRPMPFNRECRFKYDSIANILAVQSNRECQFKCDSIANAMAFSSLG